MSIKRRFTKDDIARMCTECRDWVRSQDTTIISALWARCPDGCWMAWHLVTGPSGHYYRDVEMLRLALRLARTHGLHHAYTGRESTAAQRLAFADALRRRYSSTGRKR